MSLATWNPDENPLGCLMKIFIGDNTEVLASRNTREDTSGGSMSNI